MRPSATLGGHEGMNRATISASIGYFGSLWGVFGMSLGCPSGHDWVPWAPFGSPLGQPRGALRVTFFGFVGPQVYTNRDRTLTRFRYRCFGTFLTSPWSETCVFQGSEPLVCMRRASVFTMSTVFRSRALSRSPQSVFQAKQLPFWGA